MRFSIARLFVAMCVCVCTLIFTQAVASAQPSDADIAQAKKHMNAGVILMQDPDGAKYEEAYPEFKKAHELSGSLNALLNLAICAMKLELDGEAIAHYEKYLKEMGSEIDPVDKSQVDKDLSRLRATISWVTITTDKAGTVLRDVRTPRQGPAITNEYRLKEGANKLGIHPGNHVFTAIYSGQEEKTWRIKLKNGSVEDHKFIFDPNSTTSMVTADGFTEKDQTDLVGKPKPKPEPDEPKSEGGIPIYVWIAGGVTVAAMVPMAIFMAQSNSKASEYEDARGVLPLDEQEDMASSLETTNLLADIFLGVTVAGAITTTVLLVTSLGGDDSETASNGGLDISLLPSFDPRGGGGAILTGSF